jgi:hypothetical protein
MELSADGVVGGNGGAVARRSDFSSGKDEAAEVRELERLRLSERGVVCGADSSSCDVECSDSGVCTEYTKGENGEAVPGEGDVIGESSDWEVEATERLEL